VVSASQPPELPEPEVEYRRPAWIEPPADVVPGIVPVELVLARTPSGPMGLTGIRAYPVGFGCTLHLRLREVIPGEHSFFGIFGIFGMFDMLELDPAGEFADYYLRFGVGFADGGKATNLERHRDSSRRCVMWTNSKGHVRSTTSWSAASCCSPSLGCATTART
jgi:hypothetical protein